MREVLLSGTEIDHIDGDSSDPGNLRLLCHACHVRVALSHSDHAPAKTDAEIDGVFAAITGRVDCPAPARLATRPTLFPAGAAQAGHASA